MKPTIVTQTVKSNAAVPLLATLPARAIELLKPVLNEEGDETAFIELGRLPKKPVTSSVQLSCYLRKVNQLRRENERLKRELASLQRRSEVDPFQWEPVQQAPLPLQQLSQLVESFVPARGHDTSILSSLRDLHRMLERKLREVDPQVADTELRGLVVDTMRLSLELWLESTRSSKAELARRSGQWSVYVNQDGWERTQGFDRYLDLVTLPDNPRMKKVLHTADFVLQSCSDPAPLRQRLQDALFTLRALQRPLVLTP